MALCSFSSSLVMQSSTLVDNTFINEFLPSAPAEAVKVYLYGLSLCQLSGSDNNIDSMSKVLALSEDKIFDAFAYWQEMGVVQIVNKEPFEVKYLSPRAYSGSQKIRSKAKYNDFNTQVQSILCGRMIKPIEYNEYYNLIENEHFEPEALVMIIKYCTTIKTNAINYPYIIAVAKDFANQGIKSTLAVEQKLMEQEKASEQILKVLKSLGLNREADLDERNMYLKWVNNFGFTDNVILEVAKKQNKRGGMSTLDQTLSKLFEQKLFTVKDIENYSMEKQMLYDIAKKVTASLGLYYQNLENVVEVYIKPWVNKGYDQATLLLLSSYCFKQDIKSLSLMNEIVNKFYKLGIVSLEALNEYFDSVIQTDAKIKNILNALNIVRRVNSSDRDFYKTWTCDWHFDDDIIALVAEKAKGTANPLRYMNKLLLDLYHSNITDITAAKSFLNNTKVSTTNNTKSFAQREYTKDELNAMFDSLDDIEV